MTLPRFLTTFLGACTVAHAAMADPAAPTLDQCLQAYESGQRSRQSFALTAAKRAFVTCAQAKCPADIRKQCTTWATEVDNEIPSIVIIAKDWEGNDVSDVEVRVDGELLASKLDGTPLEVDPNRHRFRFLPQRGPVVEKDWVLRVGEKRRVFHVTLGAKPLAKKPEARAPSPLPYVLGGVGIVGLGLFTYFGLHGRSIQNDLDERGCKPHCPKDEADEMDRSYLVANISLVVGVAALGGATYFYFSERSRVGVGLGSVAGRF